MKSLVLIGAVLAASQCLPEPSDPASGSTPSSKAQDAGSTADATTAADAGASEKDGGRSAAAKRLLEPGPAPFTVPTHRISWPQQQATVLVPRGARLEGSGEDALVVVGEGRNFAYHVSGDVGGGPDSAALLESEAEERAERTDGAEVWNEGERWYFRATFGDFSCWNSSEHEHDKGDVEMMIASCKSIERGAK